MRSLKECRADRLLTIRGLAEAAGVAPTTVQFVETGRSVPTFRVIRALSRALEVEPAEVAEFVAAIERASAGKAAAA